jgi:hypothetical protein
MTSRDTYISSVASAQTTYVAAVNLANTVYQAAVANGTSPAT